MYVLYLASFLRVGAPQVFVRTRIFSWVLVQTGSDPILLVKSLYFYYLKEMDGGKLRLQQYCLKYACAFYNKMFFSFTYSQYKIMWRYA